MGTYLVTGCLGFVGSATAARLIADGHSVKGIDNNCYSGMNKIRDETMPIGVADWDICEPFSMGRPATNPEQKKIDAVIHLAAIPGVRDSINDPVKYYHNNLMGTLNILELMRKFGIPKLVFASTSSVYDWQNAPYKPMSERTGYVKPGHPYAGSKLACENLCRIYHELHSLDVSVLRYFTVYGPAGRPDMFPLRVVKWIDGQNSIHLNGDGSQERDFTFIEDVVDANIKALKPIGFEVFNIGSGNPHPLLDFVDYAQETINPDDFPTYNLHPPNNLDAPFTWADNSKARDILGWKPETSLQAGIEATVKWYNSNRSLLKTIKF